MQTDCAVKFNVITPLSSNDSNMCAGSSPDENIDVKTFPLSVYVISV